MRLSTLAFVILLTTSFACGQSFTKIHYSLSQGLPSNEVYEVFQDSKKFVWFATDNGVVRFDGHTMVKFNVDQGLTDPVVFGISEDYFGRIWFRTFSSKLCYYEHTTGKIQSYEYNDKLVPLCQNAYIRSIYIDRQNQLWFGLNNRWGKIDSEGNLYKTEVDINCATYYKKVDTTYLYGYCLSPHTYPLALIDDKLLRFDLTFANQTHPVLCALEWKNKFYFSQNDDLFAYDGHTVEKVLTRADGIISLSIDAEDNLWIGRYKGVERHTRSDFKDPLILHDFDNIAVSEVQQDHEKGLWITTIGKGVYYIPNFVVRNHVVPDVDQIQSAALTSNRVLVSVKNGNLLTIHPKTHEVTTEKKFPKGISHCYVDSQKNIWVVSDQSTYVLDSTMTVRYRPKPGGLLTFFEDTDGSIWSLDKSAVLGWQKTARVNVIHLDYYYRFLLMDKTNVYLLARTGIHVYDKQFNRTKELTALADYKFSRIIDLNDSTLLLSSIGSGFFLLNKKTWAHTQFSAKSKFMANDIYTAIKTDSSIWFGTEKGVIHTSVAALLAGNPSFHILTHKRGLIADRTNLLLEVGDEIWAFFDNSYSAFPKNLALPSENPPVFYIHNFAVNDKALLVTEKVVLEHTDNNLTINFGFIDFSNQNIFARYRLSKNTPWSYTSERSLKFYSLSPGIYDFEIEYSVDNINWMRAAVSPRFTILPPWWQTWYFQTAAGFLILLIIFLYFKNQVDVYRKHQQKLIQSEIEAIEQERSRIAKDLHDSVGTDFSAIKMMVSQLLKKHNEPKSEEIESQFQSTIHEIKSIIYGLSPPGLERYGLIAGIKNYIEKLNATIPVKIELNAFGPEIKDQKLNITVFRILQELISNSLKHANATTIALHINSFEDLLNIVYEDNGKGFNWEAAKKGLGLYNIESRIQSVNGQLRFESGSFGISYAIDIPLKKGKDVTK